LSALKHGGKLETQRPEDNDDDDGVDGDVVGSFTWIAKYSAVEEMDAQFDRAESRGSTAS